MENEKLKTPTEIAEKEVNKRLGSAIAERQMQIKRHEASIKKLEKEIEKIKNGELVPEENSSSGSSIQASSTTVIKPSNYFSHIVPTKTYLSKQ